jgi:hypothetical protein
LGNRLLKRAASAARRPMRGNGKRATAAVTRYGCGWGEFFEGCDRRCGERPGSLGSRLWLGSRGCEVGKRREPSPVPGCNKPGAAERRKPSRWCETTRTERDSEGGTSGPNGGGDAIGEWTLGGHAGGWAHHEDEFQERQIGEGRSRAMAGAWKVAPSPRGTPPMLKQANFGERDAIEP